LRKRLLIALLVTVFVLTSSQLGVVAACGDKPFEHLEATLGYDDLDEAPWAAQHFMELSIKGLFRGRGNGKMAPQAAVSRLEVLALVIRALGMEEAAEELATETEDWEFAFSDSPGFRSPQVSWGLAYLRLAPAQCSCKASLGCRDPG